MKTVLKEEMNGSDRLKERIEVLEGRIEWRPGGKKQKCEREQSQQE